MSVNYAAKYSQAVDEKFALGSLTGGVVNQDFDWIGVSTVKVFSVPTVAMNDYTVSGTNRYGTPSELDNEVQEMTLRKDRAFTFTIDRKSNDDAMMTMEAGKALSRQIVQEVIPEVDKYRIAQIVANVKSGHKVLVAVTKTNAYETFLAVQELLDDAKVPQIGRICLCTSEYYNLIKLDDNFTKKGDLSQEMLLKGQVGEIDGVPVVKVPKSYMPSTYTNFVITHPIASPAPIKLEEYKIHEDAPGISGWLVEGRIRYDCFTLDQKADAIGVSSNPMLDADATAAATTRYGKAVSTLQSDVAIDSDNKITGTLKYVTGYTGYSGDVSLQSGNFIALDFTADAPDAITIEKIVDGTASDPVSLKTDMFVVARITDAAKTVLRVKVTKGSETQVYDFDLSGLTLESAG